MLRLRALRDYLSSSLWFLPALIVGGFVGLAFAVAWLDRTLGPDWGGQGFYAGSAQGARSVLATISSSMLSLAVLVFTISLIVLQLASSQLGPRVLALFLRDRWAQTAMGLFLGTFGFALMGLWLTTARTESGEGFVPGLMVSVALVLVGLSLVVFINYIHRVSQSIRVETVTREIGRQTLSAWDGLAGIPDGWHTRGPQQSPEATGDSPHEGASILFSPRSGLVVDVGLEELANYAREHVTTVRVLAPLGQFVPEGAPLIELLPHTAVQRAPEISALVMIGDERRIATDPGYGLDQLVDIALRALSPGVNEPGAAIIALDRIHEILQRVGCSDLNGPTIMDSDSRVQVTVPSLGWHGWVDRSLRPVVESGRDSVQVCYRIRRMLHDLRGVLPTDRHDVLNRYIVEIDELIGEHGSYEGWAAG